MENIDKETLLALAKEAAEVTGLFATWTGAVTIDEKGFQSETPIMKYYMKWVDIALSSVKSIDAKSPDLTDMANDLVQLIVVPLNGVIYSMEQHAKSKGIQLPEFVNKPDEIFEYKKSALEYIGNAMRILK
jgi:hypothetical protein